MKGVACTSTSESTGRFAILEIESLSGDSLPAHHDLLRVNSPRLAVRRPRAFKSLHVIRAR